MRPSWLRCFVAPILLCGGLVPWAHAQDEVVELRPVNAEAFDRFGGSVAISGDVLVAGVVFDDASGVNASGTAHVFRRSPSGWGFEQRLIPSQPTPFSFFGDDVDIDGDTIVVAGPTEARVYEWTGTHWAPRLTLPVITMFRMDFAYGEDDMGVRFFVGGAEKAIAQKNRVR